MLKKYILFLFSFSLLSSSYWLNNQKIYLSKSSLNLTNKKIINEINEEKNFQEWLDTQKNKNIKELRCPYCSLEGSGDLSKFKNLETIDFSDNQIKEINLNENNKLKYILLFNNQIKNIDLSNNINLIDLELDKNQITEIKGLKKIKDLIHIFLNNNKLQAIDLTHNLKIDTLILQENNPQLKIHLNKKYKNNLPTAFKKDDDAIVTYEDPSPEIDKPKEDKIKEDDHAKKSKEWIKKHPWFLVLIFIITIILTLVIVYFARKSKGDQKNV